jgi:hypothetical protein
MMSLIPDVLLKPVSAMTSKCGLNLYHSQQTATDTTRTSANSSAQLTPPMIPTKETFRSVSGVSTACDESILRTPLSQDGISDDEVCRRMALLGKAARKAGRHVLAGNKLILA